MIIEAFVLLVQLSQAEVEDLTGGEVPLGQNELVQGYPPYGYPPPGVEMPMVAPPYTQRMCDRFGRCSFMPNRRSDYERNYNLEQDRYERQRMYREYRCARYGECY